MIHFLHDPINTQFKQNIFTKTFQTTLKFISRKNTFSKIKTKHILKKHCPEDNPNMMACSDHNESMITTIVNKIIMGISCMLVFSHYL
jgi:hypothetical protein